MTGTMLCPRPADAVMDDWKHCLGLSDEISGSRLKPFLRWSIEDAPVGSQHEETVCVCHFHAVLCCLPGASARLVEIGSGRGVCGYTPIFPSGMALRPEECYKLARPSFACIISCAKSLRSEEKRLAYIPLVGNHNLEPFHLDGRI
jgi:hypothetical protein